MGRRGRDKSEIHCQILRAVKNGVYHQSRIAQSARVCHHELKSYLKILVDEGFMWLGELSSYGTEKVFLTDRAAGFLQQAALDEKLRR